MDAGEFAKVLIDHVKAKREANLIQMEKGKPQDEYMKFCGANRELKWVKETIIEIIQTTDEEMD